ncbi:MAG: signal peptidase I [Actinomycetota bacterium]
MALDRTDSERTTSDAGAEDRAAGSEEQATHVIEPSEPPAPDESERRLKRAFLDKFGRGKRHKKQRSTLAKVTEVPVLIIMAFAIAVVIKTFLVQAFYIPSESMLPTLRVGDRVLVEKIGYLFGDVGRGDVVVFEREVFGATSQDLPWYQDVRNGFRELLGLPTGLEEDYIKRVVAIGGDVIRYTGSPRRLYVNGERQDISYVKGGQDRGSPTLTSDDCRRLEMEKAGNGCRVPAGTVFVMGDNRGNSEDSRVIGPVDEEKIVGRAFLIIWPPSDFSTL